MNAAVSGVKSAHVYILHHIGLVDTNGTH